ncbi:type VII secretion-associated protein [Actinomycetospora sp. TBRC 11914]|uniref:type VII secretion-associated protein n=1 Tax=Actinomycetospora sp. TBRC 11914 TaxID=2729387 RepID=UPI00145EF328|nr:type VII secretion-associated protein [Actinomycetospora sp. TBRC 11914]NMO93441.1 type VII secretion-associated protein [Actinomycetospora sp. TBRC 11914]
MTGSSVAVDLGEVGVAAAVDDGHEVTELALDLAAVLAADDGEALLTGREARRRAAPDPSRLEPSPRRHVDEATMLLGTRVVGVGEALGAVLAATVDRAAPALRGARPARLVLTHPASWGTSRREVLRRAGAGLATELVLVPEPVAVAAHAAWTRPAGAADGPVAVLDVGTRTARAAVVGPGPERAVLAERSSRAFGGDDADELLLRAVLGALPDDAPGAARVREVVAGATLPDRRHRQVLVEDVRAARERLSDAEQAEIPLPGGATSAWCSRGELEDVLREPCEGLVALLSRTLDDAGVEAGGLAGLRLVGGFARTPLLGTLVHRELGTPPVVPPEPRTAAVRGALLVVGGTGAAGARSGAAALPTGAPATNGATRAGTPAGPVRAPAGPGPAGSGPAGTGSAGTGSAGTGLAVAGTGARSAPPGPPTGGLPLLPDWPRPLPPAGASPPTPSRGAPVAGPPSAPTPAVSVARPTGPTAPVPPIPAGPLARPAAGATPDPDGPTMRIDRSLVPSSSRALVRTETPAGAARWSPRRRAAAVAAVTAAVVVVVLVVAGLHGGTGGSATAAPPTVVSAFSHAYELPAGWLPDGTDAASRRSRIRPADQPRGPNLIAVQESALASPDPQSARAQLLAGYEAARAGGGGVSDLQPDATFGGRPVATYRQVAAPGTTVDWVVVFAGTTQLSVGCRHDDQGRDAVLAACAHVVSTLRSPP